jgi:excinuclease UvrABC nuclease subunit
MQALAKEKKFERAARLRDVLRFIEGLEERQVVSDTSGDDADIIGVALRHGRVHVVLLRQRGGKVIEQLGFPLKGEAETVTDVIEQFLPQYYAKTDDIPSTIILSDAPEDAGVLEGWLQEKRGKSVKIFVPERGKKSKLLLMAERNAEEKVEQQFAAWEAETKKIEGALGGLQTLLGLPHLPRRIEGYDISHLGGSATVGSMVVMVNGKPKREHYRSFNMKTVIDGEIDDYKSIAETLLRRLKYLAHTKKFEDAELARRGLMMSKARKADQKAIEKIIADNASMLGSFGIEYKNFIVVRRDDNIVAVAQLYSYEESVQAIRTVWVADSERGHRLGQTLVRRLLRDITKGKVYATIPPDLEEYYGELGFQIVKQGPDVLTKLLDEYMKKDETNTRGIIVMYQAKDHKIDESFSSMPDLLLIDGGKGQLSAVVDVLQELHLDIPVAGLAKREEEIFVPGQSYPLLVKEGSEPRFLLQRLRDEAHRFANDRRERRLTVAMTASKLDAVPGIGDSTRITLLKKFGSTDAVISASDTALREVLSEGQVKALREMYP